MEPVERTELESVLHTALSVGVRVQMAGGYTARVRDTVRRVALNLGADEAQTWLASGSLGLTVTKAGVSHTAVRTVPALGVNFTELTELSRLSKASAGKTPDELDAELAGIVASSRRYPTPVVILMLGIACGSFAGLFGCGGWGIALATIGATAGAFVRHVMLHRRFKPFVYCLFAAFVSASVVLAAGFGTGTEAQPDVATATTAAILFLVPGVPLLNGTADLLTSNYLNAVARLTRASVILLGATFGLALAAFVWGRF
ncbi:MAG: threonine/serine exporter family protein [Candidatus Nanopelagicales bacterium]